MKKILNFIGGKFVEPQSGKYLENFDPSRGEVYSLVPDSGVEDAEEALRAAEKAFPSWSKTPVTERQMFLKKIAQGLRDRLDDFATAESRDNGKPFRLAQSLDIPRSAQNFDFFADLLPQFHGEKFSSDNSVVNFTEHSPLGVVTCISPWNLPLYLFTWKIAPALAAGNTVVAKPSELTPMTAFLLGEVLNEAGLPKGVLNILHGTGQKLGEILTADSRVKAISFTGSTATGRIIAQRAAAGFKKISLEMGGKNPNIIFADAPFDEALETTVRSSFLNQGQICLCGSRIFIEKPIYEKFKTALVARAQDLRIGDPLDPHTDQGALVSKAHREKVLSFISAAESQGGKILCGGKVPALPKPWDQGYFLSPTLIENLASSSSVNQEEIFGPVATLIPFSSEEEVVKGANSTKYGLSSSLWTVDRDKALRIAHQLEAGIVWINTWMSRDLRTPFGGVKESGVGREGGFEALKFFSDVKTICSDRRPGGWT